MKKRITLLLFLFMFIPHVYGLEAINEFEEVIDENLEETTEEMQEEELPQVEECEVSEAYLYYLSLSKEERKKYIVPEYCASNGLEDIDYGSEYPSFDKASYPSSYQVPSTAVKNQDKTGTCWSFAATSVVESYVLNKYNINNTYSPGHLNYFESQSFYDKSKNTLGFQRSVNSGGNFNISSRYFINRYGPVFETDFPTVTNVENLPKISSTTVFGKENMLNVNNIELIYRSKAGACTSKEINKIKYLVSNYGPVGVAINLDKNYYNYSFASYNFKSNILKSNHEVMIVGWDDNFSKDKFKSAYKPNNNGAWIVQNSYGTDFGKKGIMYISYEDDIVCSNIFAIRSADGDMDDNKYISSVDIAHTYYKVPATMQIFNKNKNNSDEVLSKISFYVYKPGKYKVYYYAGNAKNKKLNKMKLIASGSVNYTGWVTVNPSKKIKLSKDLSKYSIAVYLSSKNQSIVHRTQNAYTDEGDPYKVKSLDSFNKGKSYFYWYGKWFDLNTSFKNEKYKSNINVFTDNVTMKILSAKPRYSYDNYFYIDFTIKALSNGTISGIELYKGKKLFAYNYEYKQDIVKGKTYTLTYQFNDAESFANGTYKLKVYASNNYIVSKNISINVIPIKEIIITNPSGTKLEVGDTLQINAVASPANFNSTSKTLTYKSSNTRIASVDESGLVTAKRVGNVTITVSSANGVTSTYDIVIHKPIKTITVDKSVIKMNVNDQVILNYSYAPTDTTDEDTFVKWLSNDSDIAIAVYSSNSSQSYVTVYALKPGIATLTGTTKSGAEKTVEVLVKGLSVVPSSAKLELKNSLMINANVIDDNFNVNHNVIYKSSNPSVASIDTNGKIYGKKLGTTTISVTDTFGRVVESKITVTKIQASSFTTNSIGVKTYTGKSIKPSIKVSYKGKKLKNKTNYKISYLNNKYPGKATIKITAKKSKTYEGTKKIYFIIKPKKAAISKLTSSSGNIKVTFKKLPKVTKYQIQYKIKEDSVWKTINVSGNKTISNLFSGFNYQVRLRGYVTVDNKNYYGAWSKVKTIKCK